MEQRDLPARQVQEAEQQAQQVIPVLRVFPGVKVQQELQVQELQVQQVLQVSMEITV